jgi:hypothetical protein
LVVDADRDEAARAPLALAGARDAVRAGGFFAGAFFAVVFLAGVRVVAACERLGVRVVRDPDGGTRLAVRAI